MPEKKGEPKPEKLLLRKYVFNGRAMNVRVDTVLTADNRRSTREVVERGDCVAVVAFDADGKLLLVNQFRTPVWKNLLEIPAGGIEKGESTEAAVVREMREETGMKPEKVARLCGFYFSPGYSNEYCHLYLATQLIPDPLRAEDTSGIELVKMSLSEAEDAIASGRIQDGKTIAGLMYYRHLEKGVKLADADTAGQTPPNPKEALKQEWEKFVIIPSPKSPKDPPLVDLFADLVLEDGEVAGVVTSFLDGKEVDKKQVFVNEDLNTRLAAYQAPNDEARISHSELVERKARLDRLINMVSDLFERE